MNKNDLVDIELARDDITGCQIDSLTIHTKIKKLLKLIDSSDISNINKIKISKFLAHNTHDYIKLSLDKCDIIIRNMTEVITISNEIQDSIRLNYLRYKNEYISFNISLNIYQNNIKNILSTISYFQILKQMLKSNRCEETIKTTILQEFETIFQHPDTSIYVKMEIADIYLLNNKIERGDEMLAIIRGLQNQRHGQREMPDIEEVGYIYLGRTGPSQNTIYADTQNVHNTKINSSVIDACIYLISVESCPPFDVEIVKNDLCSICTCDQRAMTSIDTVLERIQIDTSLFRSGDNSFTLHNLFSALWSFIEKHTHKNEIKKILVQEIIAMSKYCSTGHLSRFINVIQGFHDIPDLKIKISNEDQVNAVIINFLNITILQEESDEISDSMISKNKQPFLDFVKTKMNEKIPSIILEYDLSTEEHEHIINSVKKYTRYEEWIMSDGVISYK